MKKFIKKSIAGLIAGIMAISSMPFAAVTAQAADSTEKAYVKANIASFNGYTGTAKYTYNGTDLSSADSSFYSNILYDDGGFNDTTSQSDSDNMHGKLYINNNTVLLYDGKNDTVLPVVIRPWTTSKTLAAAIYFSGSSVEDSTTSTSWELKENWLGGQQTYNQWPTGTSSYPSSSISYGNGMNLSTGKDYLFKNKLYYKGSTSSTYYQKFNNSIKLKIKAYYTSWGSNSGKDIDVTNSTSNVYVVNYKPIANAISTMKSVYNTIQATGEDKYCSDYLENFYQAAYKVMTLNPNSYSYSSGVEAAVQQAGNDIKNVVDNYLSTATTEPGKHTAGTATRENEVAATCTADGSYDEVVKCSHCGTELSRTHMTTPATGHTYVYTNTGDADAHKVTCEKGDLDTTEAHDFDENGKCKKCGYQKIVIDYSAFDAAVETAEKLTNEDEKYTADSFAAYQAKVAEIKAKRDTAANQEELDALITELANANDLLKAAAFTVKLVYVDEDGNEKTADTKTVKYGETYEAVSDKNVDKWTVETDNGQTTTKLNVFDKTVSVIITKDATIKAFQTEEATEVATSKVTFVGKNNIVVAIKYVQEGYEFNTSKVAVPAVPFYSSNGWDTESITGDGKEYTVRAVYTCTQSEDDMCNVHFGEWSKKYSYDSYVYLFNADKSLKYALYSNEACTQLLTILDGVDFYAPKTSNIYVKEYTETLADAVIGVTGTFVETTDSAKSAVYNCKFYLPENATAIEWGLEVTLNGKTVNVKAESKSSRNEYSVRLNAPTTFTGEISGRAYVTYKLGDQTITKYSSAVNQTL